MSILFYLSVILFVLLSSLLCLAVLIQESKSLGLGASFGGDAGESLFGASTADVLKKFTAWLGVCFLACSILLSIWSEAGTSSTIRHLPLTIEESGDV